MRSIRLVVALLILVVILLPQIVSASETSNTDTKIKFNLNTIANFLFPGPVLAKESVQENAEPVKVAEEKPKTEEDLRTEAVLAKWKEKQAVKWNNLPKGEFTINASAYTAAADECGNSKGITASGMKVREKRTIACPPEFPFGAKIQIEGYGTYVCEDRGGAIKGNKIDIYVPTKAEAFQFGRRNLVAQVVE